MVFVTNEEGKSPIIPNQLRMARVYLELSLEEAAERLGVQPEELAQWEERVSEPPIERLWDMAELYQRPVDYFVTETPPLPEEVSFRLTTSRAMKELSLEVRYVITRFEELCRSATEMERLLQKPHPIRVPRLPGERNPERLAAMERERLGLGERPIDDLRGLLEEQGVRIFELPVPGDVFSGLSWWHDDYGPCILVNARDVPGRRAFTMTHEYAHLLAETSPTVCDLNLDVHEERFANRFARSFLMPASDVKNAFQKRGYSATTLTAKNLGSLARRYRVSLEAMGRRLEELQLIRAGTTDSFIQEWEARPRRYRRPKAPTWQRRLGDTFVTNALDAYSEGHISIGKLAEYLGLDLRKAMDIVKEDRDKFKR